MSQTTLRVLSWAGTLVIIAAAAVGVTRLPGYDGIEGELRWLLGRPPTTASLNRAAVLTLLAEKKNPGVLRPIWTRLVRDPNPLVGQNALLALTDKLRSHRVLHERETRDALDILREYVKEAGVTALPPGVQRGLTETLGPDWRTRLAGGGATSQPGAGDGGG